MKKTCFDAENWRDFVPAPVCGDHPEYVAFYEKAWQLVRAHVKHIPGLPQTPYMDEGFCECQMWIWDTCFMSLFCKYAQAVFPGVETFNNFYQVLYDGKSLPQLIPSPQEPRWAYRYPGELNDICIHIADNPPLFAWGEYENALISGDLEHVKTLLYDHRYLQKHYEWIEGLKAPEMPHGVSNVTCLIAEEVGYRWEGGRSGMDNTPRGRKRIREGTVRPNNPDLLWVDAICQQALSARMISRLFAMVQDEENSLVWQRKFDEKQKLINRYYWDEQDKFYYDIDVNSREFCRVMTVASYWALTAGVASQQQAEALAAYLDDENTFGGELPLVSLARNDGDFYEDGHYWRGGFWLPTAYAALKGLASYGYRDRVHAAAHKMLRYMLQTYREYEPHTIWECYAPVGHKPALDHGGVNIVRRDFCGWSALGPISIFIEYVLGFHTVNALTKTVEWAYPSELTGEVGIKNLRFGSVVTDIVAQKGICHVTSTHAYTLIVDGRPFAVKEGTQTFSL